jgi:hypothetical protein
MNTKIKSSNGMQVWFLAEHLIDGPQVVAD